METRYSTRHAARLVGLSAYRIRALARLGLVGQSPHKHATDAPDARKHRAASARPNLSFSFEDLSVLRSVAKLLAQGVAPARLQQVLVRLQRHLRRHGGMLSAVCLELEGERLMARDAQRRWDAESGQVLIVSEAKSESCCPTSLPTTLHEAPPPSAAEGAAAPTDTAHPTLDAAAWKQISADTWFDMALVKEDAAPLIAYELYLRALACDPLHVEAMLNIGRLCSLSGDKRRAIAYFKVAIAVDPEHPVAHFNMAVTLHDAGELSVAEVAYRAALRYDPFFADAHYNLATLLEQQGAPDEASQHFVAYRLALRPSPAP